MTDIKPAEIVEAQVTEEQAPASTTEATQELDQAATTETTVAQETALKQAEPSDTNAGAALADEAEAQSPKSIKAEVKAGEQAEQEDAGPKKDGQQVQDVD